VHEPHEVLVRVAAERGVGPVESTGVEERIPGVFTEVPRDQSLEQVEDDALHEVLLPMSGTPLRSTWAIGLIARLSAGVPDRHPLIDSA